MLEVYFGAIAIAVCYRKGSCVLLESFVIPLGEDCSNIANVCHTLGEFELCISYFQKSLTICREIGNKSTEGLCLGNMGTVHYTQGKL